MSSPEGSARPSQVTFAGWGIAVASVMLVISVFDSMANLRSVDMRETIAEAVGSGSAKGLGLSVEDVTEILRWSFFVTGFAAVAAGILGVFVLQRNRSARIGLTVAAVPIALAALVTAPFAGSFLGMFIAAGTTVLWTRPARDWFDGRPPVAREVPRMPEFPPLPEYPSATTPPAPPAADAPQPPPTQGWGQAPPVGAPQPPPPAPNPYGYYPPAPRAQVPWPPSERPGQVRLACILTWVFSAVTSLAFLGLLTGFAVDSDAMLEQMRDAPGWDSAYEDFAVAGAVVVSVIFLVWCLGAAVLAVFAWRRQQWAWILLLVSTGLAALIGLIGIPASLVHLAALATTFGALLSKQSRDWFSGR